MGHRAPRQVVVQITERCNAECPQCGMAAGRRISRRVAETHVMTGVVDHAARIGVRAISFTGGEPFLHRSLLLYLIRRATAAGIRYTRTGTNGFLLIPAGDRRSAVRVHELAASLADAGLRNLWISLDSADPDVHERRRGLPGVIAGIEAALPVFAQYGIHPAANLGVNRYMGRTRLASHDPRDPAAFADAVAEAAGQFFDRVLSLGFTMANLCYPMSFPTDRDNGCVSADAPRAVYAASSNDDSVSFSLDEKVLLYRGLARAVAEARPRLRVFTPLSSLEALARDCERLARGASPTASFPCLGGRDYFFVSVGGLAYPCGFRGDDCLGPFRALSPGSRRVSPHCRECDWECFRDPSQLFGQAWALHQPIVGRVCGRRDKLFALWLGDVRYAYACRFFDGRLPLDRQRLSRACGRLRDDDGIASPTTVVSA